MTSDTNSAPDSGDKQAVEHLSEAHTLLQDLRKEMALHPKLEDAILRLETALNILTTKSGGML